MEPFPVQQIILSNARAAPVSVVYSKWKHLREETAQL